MPALLRDVAPNYQPCTAFPPNYDVRRSGLAAAKWQRLRLIQQHRPLYPGFRYQVCHMVPEQRVKTCVYQVCHIVKECHTKEIPYQVCRMVPETCVKQVP